MLDIDRIRGDLVFASFVLFNVNRFQGKLLLLHIVLGEFDAQLAGGVVGAKDIVTDLVPTSCVLILELLVAIDVDESD